MAKYELLYIIPGKYTEEELPAIITSVKEVLNKNQVTLIKEQDLGKKKLAYNIGEASYGYYLLNIFSAEGGVIIQIDKALTLMPEILRHQIVLYVDPAKTTGKAPRVVKSIDEKPELAPLPTPKPKTEEISLVDSIKEKSKEATEEAERKEKAKPKIDLDKLDEQLDELLKDDLNI